MVSEEDFQSFCPKSMEKIFKIFPQAISLWELDVSPIPDESLHEISSHLAN